jgi:hypothetical protein
MMLPKWMKESPPSSSFITHLLFEVQKRHHKNIEKNEGRYQEYNEKSD